jgi:hypothetical protein
MDDEELDEIEKELNDINERSRLRRRENIKGIGKNSKKKKLGELKRKEYNLKKELKEIEEKRKKSN